jgi:hypothetical protein
MSMSTIEQQGSRRRRRARWLVFVLTLVLFLGVVWKLSAGGDWSTLAHALAAASPWQLAALVAFPLLNLLLTAATFWILTNDDRPESPRVGFAEMSSLIAAASVVNLLPIKAGMFGRIAYHKVWNEIPVRQSVRVVIFELLASALACALLLGVTMASEHAARSGPMWLAAPLIVLACFATLLRVCNRAAWRVVSAVALQYADMLVWAWRYLACFAVMDRSLSSLQATSLTVVAQATSLIPLGGSSLGLREWAIALVAPSLPKWAGDPAAASVAQGLSADLLNRAGELLALVPIGLVAAAFVARRMSRSIPAAVTSPARPDAPRAKHR